MPEFTIRSESVDVEQIMEQIRTRIREKRGVDYTEEQLRELAAVKLERFLDPRGVRSDLLERFRQVQGERDLPPLPNYAFEEETLYQTHRGPIRWIRKLLQPILKLFFNPNALIQALNVQSRLNTLYAEREAARHAFDQLHFELMHNLVVETTRIGIEVKNLKMQVESLGSRLEFNERRARALESAVVYAPAQSDRPAPSGATVQSTGMSQASIESSGPSGLPVVSSPQEGPGQRSRRRRRRRGRRGGGSAAAIMGGIGASPNQTLDASGSPPEEVAGPTAFPTDTTTMSTVELPDVHAESPDEPESPAVESPVAEPRQSDTSPGAMSGPGGSEPEQQ